MDEENKFGGYGSYQDFIEKVGRAQERMELGAQTLREYYSPKNILDRTEHKARIFGLSGDRESIYSRQEQMAMAKGDMISKIGVGANATAFGIGSFATSLLPGGSTSMAFSKAAMFSMIGGGALTATGVGGGSGLMKIGGIFGSLSNITNPTMMAGTVALKGAEYFMTHGVIDPYVNASMYQGSVLSAMRGVLGGTQSRLGTGGLSMTEGLGLGQSLRNMQLYNRDISPQQMNAFIEQAGNMPQMQFATSPEQAMQNIQKVVEFGAKITKYFGEGKGREALQTIAQFGTMGMNIDQATRAFERTQQMGTLLNIDPSRIMGVGASVTQMAMGTGVSQGTLYNVGIQNFERAQRMAQSGALTQSQIQNFGGTEGIAQLTTGIQMKFFQSRLGESVLRSMYAEGTNDPSSMGRLATGQMSLAEQRIRSTNVTLSPLENMKFQMDKDQLISNMGENMNSIFFNQMNKLFANRNPYGDTIQGRAKWMMATGIVQDKQQAMIMAQQWMQDPALEKIREERQIDQMMEQNDLFYSSGTKFGRGMAYLGRTWDRGITALKRDTPLALLDPTTYAGGRLQTGMYTIAKSLGLGPIAEWLRATSNTRDSRTMEMPFSSIKNTKEFIDIANYIRETPNLEGYTPEDIENRRIARVLPYSQLENYRIGDRDNISDIRDSIREEASKIQGSDSEKIKQLAKIYGINEASTYKNLKNMDVSAMRTLEGLYYEQTLSPETKDKIYKTNLAGGKQFSEFKTSRSDFSWSTVARHVGWGTLAGMGTGAALGAGIGAGPGALFGAVSGLVTGLFTAATSMTDTSELANKFGTSDAQTQIKMAQQMKTLAEGGDIAGKIRASESEKLLIGDRETAIRFYRENQKAIDDMMTPEIQQKMMKEQKSKDLIDGISSVYGSNYYTGISTTITGKAGTIESLVQKFVGTGQEDESALNISKEQYLELKERFKGQAGIGSLLAKTSYDEASGKINIKETMSKRERETILSNIYTSAGGLAPTAEKLWEQKMTQRASSIQDFATAFTKGLEMYYGKAGAMTSTNWNQVTQNLKEQ